MDPFALGHMFQGPFPHLCRRLAVSMNLVLYRPLAGLILDKSAATTVAAGLHAGFSWFANPRHVFEGRLY
jgi:hypothetical protein